MIYLLDGISFNIFFFLIMRLVNVPLFSAGLGLSVNKCCDWTGPCGSYYDCKTLFSNNHHETLKQNKDVLLIWPGNYIAHMRPHSKVSGRKRKKAKERERDQLGLSLLLTSLFHQVINHNLWLISWVSTAPVCVYKRGCILPWRHLMTSTFFAPTSLPLLETLFSIYLLCSWNLLELNFCGWISSSYLV